MEAINVLILECLSVPIFNFIEEFTLDFNLNTGNNYNNCAFNALLMTLHICLSPG